MTDRILKVTRAGVPLLEGRRIEAPDLEAELERLAAAGDRLVYYREAPLSDPAPQVLELVQRLVASGVPLVTSDQVPSEWGELGSFSLYEAPASLRLRVDRGGSFLFTHRPEGADRPLQLEVGLPPNERLRAQLDLLVRSDRILELEQHEPERSFHADEVESPSLHLRIEYMDRAPWRSWYAPDDVPDNVRSLVEDCRSLGLAILGRSA